MRTTEEMRAVLAELQDLGWRPSGAPEPDGSTPMMGMVGTEIVEVMLSLEFAFDRCVTASDIAFVLDAKAADRLADSRTVH